MARKWSNARKKQRSREPKKERNDDPAANEKYGQERDPYTLVEGGNFKMEAFYAYQGIHNYYFVRRKWDVCGVPN